MAIVPVPTTRISGLLARERLLAQLQGDQLDIFRLQNQVSTGRRITLPSEDAPAAQRAVTLQRLLERKTQLQSSVDTARRFLANTDSSLTGVAGTLGDIRGAVLGVAGTTSSQAERDEVVNQVNAAIESLVGIANSRFLGRYLFAGSQTNVKPYSFDGDAVHYAGNSKSVDNYTDIGVLFSTNAAGVNVFGGISGPVLGGADLNPHLSADTPLASLRRGHGISPNGALKISDGTNSVIVDMSRATTLGDVARLIEANAPPGREITVGITSSGLTLQLDASGSGNLTVSEVGSGSAASELRILNTVGVGTGVLTGGDLEPVIQKTTPLSNLLGAKARGRLTSAGDNNDLLIEATTNGTQFNGATIQIVDDPLQAGASGSEYAQYDSNANTLTVFVAAGESTANDVAAAINAQGAFRVELVASDASSVVQAGTGLVSLTSTATLTGGGGGNLDLASGLRIVNGGQTHVLDFTAAESVEDLLNTLNHPDLGIAAEINADATGINVRSRLSGSDFQIGENGGQLATQLGLRSLTAATPLGDLNFGVGVPAKPGADYTLNRAELSLTTRSGLEFDIDLSAAVTVADVINAINTATGSSVTVQTATGGGITLIDNTAGQGELNVRQTGLPLSITGGVPAYATPADFSITARSGQTFNVSLVGVTTMGDAISRINAATGGQVAAALATVGNGVQLTDNSVGGGALSVASNEGSEAARLLGLVPANSTTATSTTGTLVGADQNFLETESVFTTLLRLRDALAAGDLTAISRSIAAIDVDVDRVAFAQAEVGSRERALDASSQSLEDEDVELRSALSEEIEVDLVEAISNLTARQVSIQASLQAIANIMQLSLMNFL